MCCACSKKPQSEPLSELPKTFAFTETNVVVGAEEIETPDNEGSTLKADFNQDGLSDLAIIKKEGEIQNKVDIYIQQPQQAAGGSAKVSQAQAKYFKGGTIERPITGRITGIASASNDKLVNIVILVTHSNSPNEWIQYRNDGGSFTEVEF